MRLLGLPRPTRIVQIAPPRAMWAPSPARVAQESRRRAPWATFAQAQTARNKRNKGEVSNHSESSEHACCSACRPAFKPTRMTSSSQCQLGSARCRGSGSCPPARSPVESQPADWRGVVWAGLRARVRGCPPESPGNTRSLLDNCRASIAERRGGWAGESHNEPPSLQAPSRPRRNAQSENN